MVIMAGKIQTGYLVSYDYELLKTSLPTVYSDSDEVFIAIDKNRNTWNGGSFSINDSFFEWIKAFDVDKKVVIYEDDFSESADAYIARSLQKDEIGNKLTANTESNGRFHSDWLSMIYPRIRLARNLLRDDGLRSAHPV